MESFACCRPLEREQDLPVILLDRVFATFIEESQTAVLTDEDYTTASNLRRTMCEFYKDKEVRAAVLRKELEKYDIKLAAAKIGSSRCSTDGHIEINSRPVLILEVKNEIGTGNAEPSIQALCYYNLFFTQYTTWTEVLSHHPCFIIFVAGKRRCYFLCCQGD